MPRGDHFKMSDSDKKRLSELSRKYIAEEKESKKYKPRQAVAIGLARARREVKGASASKKTEKAPAKKQGGFWDFLK